MTRGGDRRVRHAAYGLGTVVKVERGGLALRVVFDKFPGLDVSLPSRLLRLADAAPGAVSERAPDSRPNAPIHADRAEKLQILEALRLGVVPTRGLLAYTVGRDAEVDALERVLAPRREERALSLLGDYGAGKTHMLELAQHLALEAGFVVGRAWLDPQEAPPSKPRRVYAALVRSLVYPDRPEAGECGLAPLLFGAPGAGEARTRVADLVDEDGERHVFLSPALRFAAAIDRAVDENADVAALELGLVDWIEGRATGRSQELQRDLHAALDVRDRVLALSDYGTLPRVYGYLLSGLARLAKLCGYEGLCLLLDETELFSNLDAQARARAVDVFRVLLGAALPHEGRASLDLSGVRRGGRGIIRRLPPRFGRESPLALVLAATPGSESEDFLRATLGGARVRELARLSAADFREMGDRILGLYLDAHPDLSRRVLAALESKVDEWLARGMCARPREFARRVVDWLDQCRHARYDYAS